MVSTMCGFTKQHGTQPPCSFAASPLNNVDRVLITGGAGFIGSALCRELSRQGHEVFVLDDLSFGRRGLAPVDDAHFDRVDFCTTGSMFVFSFRLFEAVRSMVCCHASIPVVWITCFRGATFFQNSLNRGHSHI